MKEGLEKLHAKLSKIMSKELTVSVGDIVSFALIVFVIGCVSGCSTFTTDKEKVKRAVVRGNFEVLLDDEILKCDRNKACLKKLEKRIQTPLKKERFVSCYDKVKGSLLLSEYKKITLKVCE